MHKRQKHRRGFILLAVILFLIVTGIYIFIDNNRVRLTPYTIYSTKLPEEFKGYKIALISDFHNSYFYDQIINLVEDSSPDLILLAGDMVRINQDTFDNTEALLSKLPVIAPTYMVQGNHDAWYPNYKQLRAMVEENGVTMLYDRQLPLTKGNSKIYLYGLNDPFVHDSELDDSDVVPKMMKTLKNAWDPNTFSMLLMHRANLFKYMNDVEYDLVMAGHIHGGLIRLPFMGGLVSSEYIWFPDYTRGIYTKKGSKMVVTVGCDYDLSKVRVFNGPEMVLITLQK